MPYDMPFARLSSGWVLVYRGDELLLWSTTGALVLRGAPTKDLESALDLSGNRAGVETLRATFSPGRRAALAGLLRILERRGVLEMRPSLPDPVLASYGSLFGAAARGSLAKVTIYLVGDGAVATTVGALLRHAKMRIVRRSSWRKSRARIVPSLDSSRSVIVYCPENPFDASQQDVNAEAVSAQVPWIRGVTCAQFAVVGPAVLPGKTACFTCYVDRSAANWQHHPGFEYSAAVADGLLGDPVAARSYCRSGEAVATLAAGYLVLEILRLASGTRPITAGNVWQLDAIEGTTRLEPVLRQPRCRICGVQGPSPDPWDRSFHPPPHPAAGSTDSQT